MVAVKLIDIMSGSITFEKMLSIRALVWLFVMVGCKVKGINEFNEKPENLKINWSNFLIITQGVNIKYFKYERSLSRSKFKRIIIMDQIIR